MHDSMQSVNMSMAEPYLLFLLGSSLPCQSGNPKCGMEFCWKCLANRKVIEVHGNHHHKLLRCKQQGGDAPTKDTLPYKV